MPLHPELRRLLDATPPDAGLEPTGVDAVEEACRMRARPLPPVDVPGAVPTTDLSIPGPAGALRARLYKPARPNGLVVHLHGGGWVIGSIEQDDFYCQLVARDAGCAVLSVDYRLAPEHPFPAPLEDAHAAVLWAAQEAEVLCGRAVPLGISGISAGGNLAAAVTTRLRDAGGPALAGQVLLYPVCDAGMDTPSYAANGTGYRLTAAAMRWFWDCYAPRAEERFHPEASVLRGPRFEGLPPAAVLTCEYDPLRDEGDAYARRLAAAGVRVEHIEVPGVIHGFLRTGWNLPWGAEPLARVCAALRRSLEDAASATRPD